MGIVDFYIELCTLEEKEKEMKLVEPYAKMLPDLTPDPEEPFTLHEGIHKLRRVEYRARVSHGSEDKVTPDSWDRFLRANVLGKGDWSVTEHEKVTCEFLVDRGIGYEIVRHRIRLGWGDESTDSPLDGSGAYTQESTRFINYKKRGGEAKFIKPMVFAEQEQDENWYEAISDSEKSYMRLVEMGVSPQIARSVFPNALATKIIATYNLRTWRHFFVMRTSAQAHPQMRQVTEPLLAEFKEKIPILYEDIIAGGQQSEMTKLSR